jgi:hypothetical protein
VEELIKCLDDDLSDGQSAKAIKLSLFSCIMANFRMTDFFIPSDFMKPWIWEKKLIIMQQQMTEAALLFGKTREIRQDVRESVRGLDFKR